MNTRSLPEYKHVFVIGNGFDLACGLPTSYSDFLNSDQFSTLENENNKIAIHLREKHELQRWVDIEHEFIPLSASNVSRAEDFHLEYKALCAALIGYLKSIDYGSIDSEIEILKKLRSLLQDGTVCVLNFNYTKTIQELFGVDTTNLTHIHVHGSLTRNEIVFGVHDRARINSKHVFLRKAYSDELFSEYTVGKLMCKASDSVSVFGHSLGETDTNQFYGFFGPGENLNGTELNLYCHTEQSRLDLFEQLERLSSNRLQELRMQHTMNVIEVT